MNILCLRIRTFQFRTQAVLNAVCEHRYADRVNWSECTMLSANQHWKPMV